MRRFLAKIDYPILIFIAVLLGLSPFYPEPHLIEKLRMLFQGTLTRPLDFFDLLFHVLPTILLVIKIGLERPWQKK
ncbi:hypothetical protein SAMN05660860_01798 [Geoalkalibacter ferrihydriticus]|uniref:RND transporter n=2 Tax=Geoalkalibacter ferrihydriticus TaxID=392333 RepID=A0A0C2EDN2_9BACT|nr:hypothetical protein [Geoalkalibacter ferrihydriticus]KIH76653.1 RND transporter [Geoalkalibacter ferrihydriticus DSM 17813]SDM05136.1 hypothetical protein SAMN05660860_01798 [Geoalkalibacter ferrihydriticus]